MAEFVFNFFFYFNKNSISGISKKEWKVKNYLKILYFNLWVILDEMFEITYEAYHYEIGIDCLNVTFLNPANGTSRAS